ncbi:SAVED domain-containing protein [Polyangium aurulentum]|uniref:SAVED domain-containing protein n=1 Tax=Polyangium aurulentum TaxID=2567896 RepID=UPI00146DD427|nr:SAVED domain-containing protein [Polyangium aurulentum]UQA57427.1 SAVED domain-containing protein [Polyangium aurulentum]
MLDPNRLLVVSHPVLAAIGRDDIERAIPKRQRAGGWDHVEIAPLRTELGKSREIDWATALAEQERLFVQCLEPEIVGRQRLAYFGFAPIPLALHLGYRVERRIKVDVYQRHHGREDWVWAPDDATATRALLKPLNLPEHGSMDAGPVVLRVSTSHRISPTETEEVIPRSLAVVDIALADPDEDALETRGALTEVVAAFNLAISRLKRLFPNLTAIHLFAAIPVGLAFRLGTQINPTIYPDTVTYQYWAKGSPKYRGAIVLGEEAKTVSMTLTGAGSAPHFLDEAAYPWSKPEALEFLKILASAYATSSSVDLILKTSGVDTSHITWSLSVRDIWKEALEVAARARRTRQLWQCARDDESIAAHHPALDGLKRGAR